MDTTYFKRGLFVLLFLLAFLNFYKTLNLYSNPDFPYDGRNVHLGGKLWLKGLNPYNDSLLNDEWRQIVNSNSLHSTKSPGFPDSGFIYPSWSVPILIPYYWLQWPLSKIFIWLLSFLFMSILVWYSYQNFKYLGIGLGFLLLIILGFKSTSVALVLGQPFLFSLAAIAVSWYYYLKNKDIISGLIFGMAMVKITLCIPFLLLFLIHKKWKLLFFSSFVPFIGFMSFYAVSGQFFVAEMLDNISYKMQLNYSGNTINAMNTNLTELGILFNYFGEISYAVMSKFNIIMFLLGSGFLLVFYYKKYINQAQLLSLLILWNFLFSYHQIYDCLLLIFLLPLVKTIGHKWIWLVLLSPLFLPINGVFKSVDWIQFHLPITLLGLFLYISYECYKNYKQRLI
jgi:hypothetical protein